MKTVVSQQWFNDNRGNARSAHAYLPSRTLDITITTSLGPMTSQQSAGDLYLTLGSSSHQDTAPITQMLRSVAITPNLPAHIAVVFGRDVLATHAIHYRDDTVWPLRLHPHSGVSLQQGALWFTPSRDLSRARYPLGVQHRASYPTPYTRATATQLEHAIYPALGRMLQPTELWRLPICPSVLGILELMDHLPAWGLPLCIQWPPRRVALATLNPEQRVQELLEALRRGPNQVFWE
jgi:hypothetical protein